MYETIARLCFEKGITIAAMCKELGLRQEIVSDLKHGRAKMLSIGTASLIADYLAVTVDELVDPQRSIEDTTALSEEVPRVRLMLMLVELTLCSPKREYLNSSFLRTAISRLRRILFGILGKPSRGYESLRRLLLILELPCTMC